MVDPTPFMDLSEHFSTIVVILLGCLGIIGGGIGLLIWLGKFVLKAVWTRLDNMATNQEQLLRLAAESGLLATGDRDERRKHESDGFCPAHSGFVATLKNFEQDRLERGRQVETMGERLVTYIGQVEVRLTNRLEHLENRQNGFQKKEPEAV